MKMMFFDSVEAIGLHNGVVRLRCVRLDAVGKAADHIELLLPFEICGELQAALQRISPAATLRAIRGPMR